VAGGPEGGLQVCLLEGQVAATGSRAPFLLNKDSLLEAEAYVIPISIAKKRLIIKVRGQQFQAKVHAVDLGFAITFYKIQGQTLPLLILNPYKGMCTRN
jgi:hypothetical protein